MPESDDFIFRDALPGDKEEVLALTARTWEDGDYIHWVFDDWVSDTKGRFLTAVESSTGRIVGIDKMSFLSATEAWFEGLRVHPEYRGQGLAARLERFMIAEASRAGARTIRFLTSVDNLPVHLNAYRHGFSKRFIVRPWRWTAPTAQPQARDHQSPLKLRPATADEASVLCDWWRRSSAWQATDGLLHRDWKFSGTSRDEWIECAGEQELLVASVSELASLTLPPPMALISTDATDEGNRQWTISTISASGAEWGELASALIDGALKGGVSEIFGLLPDAPYMHSSLQEAGFVEGSDMHCLCLFELYVPDEPEIEPISIS